MDALALVECQRITAVLESGVEKLGILASLTTDLHNEVHCEFPRLGVWGGGGRISCWDWQTFRGSNRAPCCRAL